MKMHIPDSMPSTTGDIEGRVKTYERKPTSSSLIEDSAEVNIDLGVVVTVGCL
jgi:hypothetical protein